MSAPRCYVDTSAYLCVVLGERGHAAVEDLLDGAHLCSSVLLVLEARRNLVRLGRAGELTAAEMQQCLDRIEADREMFSLRDVTMDLCASGVLPVVSTPRSLDLVHLRTAHWFHEREPLTRFVTLDDAQALAARELSLPVASSGVRPGSPP